MAAENDILHLQSTEEREAESSLFPFVDVQDDAVLAQELQLQEVLEASANPTKPLNESTSRPGSDRRCDICEQLIPPADVLGVTPPCPHVLCNPCLCRYVEDAIRRNKHSVVKCPHARCDAVLQPELYGEFVGPRLFDAWLDAHHLLRVSEQDGLRKNSTISVEKLHAEDPSKHPSFRILIQGDYSRDDVTELISVILNALEDDPKGKQILASPASATELGESSSAAAGRCAEFDCGICMETRKAFDGFDVEGCFHRFCRSCMRNYVAAKVEQNAASIGCPDPECKEGTLDPEMCREIIPEAVFDRWGRALCEAALGADKFYCPYRDCSALLTNDGSGCDVMTDAECPHCHRRLCRKCEVPWHEGIDCTGFMELDEDERGREDLMLRNLATSSKWQRCPQCRMYVEKLDGCMFISCRCGFGFCYVCASPMPKEIHYCQRCAR